MFGLCISMLILLVLLYKGTQTLVKMTDNDINFMKSDKMKWGIIILALILIVGTMIDLYFSLTLRTFYLTFLHYPDIMGVEAHPPNYKEEIIIKPKKSSNKYEEDSKDKPKKAEINN